MRISDWSSDVCSSDLRPWRKNSRIFQHLIVSLQGNVFTEFTTFKRRFPVVNAKRTTNIHPGTVKVTGCRSLFPHLAAQRSNFFSQFHRSEEHTSELQSLMRISYADFFLQKKNQIR